MNMTYAKYVARLVDDEWVRVSRKRSRGGRDSCYHTSTELGCDIMRNLSWRWANKRQLAGHDRECEVCAADRTARNQDHDYRTALSQADPDDGWGGVDVPQETEGET